MQYPTISIITPTYNAQETLKDCIESVAQQQYPFLEHLIIDGVSNDQTLSILAEYAAKYPHIKWRSEKDKGIYDAMNKGITLAQGEWLFFLGADDILLEGVCQKIFSQLDVQNLDLIYGKVRYQTYECGEAYIPTLVRKQDWKTPFVHRYMHHQGTFIRKKLFETFGKYSLKYMIGADIHFFIKVIDHPNVQKKFVDLYFTELGEDGVSSQVVELKLSYDFPMLAKKHLQVDIDRKSYYRTFAKYYFDDIYQKNLLKGLLGIGKIMLFKGDIIYYLNNTLYWLKRRIYKK
ncbi:MAG: glycosyltransferase family 2 protein [Thermonemataceae bacterium]